MNPEQLSQDLRETASDVYLDRRRDVACLALTAASCMGLIALYQLGVIGHLPEPPLPRLNADKVDAAPEAYERLQVGDAFLGFVSYGITLLLAGAGSTQRHRTAPWLPLGLAAKALVDAAQAATLTVKQWPHHRAFCFWCLTAAAATFTTVPLTWPEARAALSRQRGGLPPLDVRTA